ncbi:MAG: HAD hydrolase-like protein [Chloroflexota bacterium]
MRAIIFDFDGVVADTEESHLASYQAVLDARGHVLSADDYRTGYIGHDDRGVFARFMATQS